MILSEFWNGLFAKYLQYILLCGLAMIHAVIILLLSVGCWLGLKDMIYKHNEKKKRDMDDEYYAKAFEALQEKKRAIMNRINKAKAEKETQNGFADISKRKGEEISDRQDS